MRVLTARVIVTQFPDKLDKLPRTWEKQKTTTDIQYVGKGLAVLWP